MKLIITILLVLATQIAFAKTKTIHIYVALCDNENQGIVPVPETLGNGKDAFNNLYWGAAYGVKSYFQNRTNDWKLVGKTKSTNKNVLERILFKHSAEDIYILAEAYDGEKIKECVEDFLLASNSQNPLEIEHQGKKLYFGGNADLLAFVGHNGLMDFDVSLEYLPTGNERKEVIILACYSQYYFSSELKKANANSLLLTTNLMAPEAYTLKAAIDGWIKEESNAEIKERAARSYNKYQKCGLRGARSLFTTDLKN